jgi:hypothetical protein
MTEMASPYPATAYLSATLKSAGHIVDQADLSLELALDLFTADGLSEIAEQARRQKRPGEATKFFLEAFEQYRDSIDGVIRFLQGKDPSLALRIVNRSLLPEGTRFFEIRKNPDLLQTHFGALGLQDQAKYFATVYLEELADVIRDAVDPRFEFSRYGEKLASSQTSFTTLYKSLQLETLIDRRMIKLFDRRVRTFAPDLIGFSVPFPGNLYSALRMGRHARQKFPAVKTVAGGGFVNTELRGLADKRFFEFIDYLTLDDGERPLLNLIAHLENKGELLRTRHMRAGRIAESKPGSDPSFKTLPAPDYSGLPLDRYLSLLPIPNPMHRLWAGFRWNKMILAHGCYWKRCSFCDVNLDYIGRFEPQKVENLVAQIESIAARTGSSGFHFVDEAAPPALLKALSEELIRRKIKITWWGNLRFDKQFTPELAALMAEAGCVAVTGGLEVANDRLLKLMNKGVTVAQVRSVCKGFKRAGIYVHAYLMYGFPSQTQSETVQSLEIVRRMFRDGCLDSAHWHRFLATAHSPVAREPQKFGVELQWPKPPKAGLFAEYAIPFRDSAKVDHDQLGHGLQRALYNYMHGVGLDREASSWLA